MIEKRVTPSQEGWRFITDNMGFDMTSEETELAVSARLQRRAEQAVEVAELLKGWETGSGKGQTGRTSTNGDVRARGCGRRERG